MQFCWWARGREFVIGRHTRAICERLTRANEDWRAGRSTYIILKVPFRHGKSDIVSRALPAWFLGCNADRGPDVLMTGYGAELVAGFSRAARRIISSDSYREVFPGVRLCKTTDAKWSIAGSTGEVTATGLGGAITGTGAHLIVVDDYCKSRAEAVSCAWRERTWDAFRNDVFTRQNAPAAIVIVCATPWHVDDLIGRIKREMAANDSFPRFEELSFPARRPGEYECLFPERFPARWYAEQRAMLGRQAAALLDCSPTVEGGERFDVSRVRRHYESAEIPRLREVRGWDLASSSKERDGDDPDWTWGVRLGVRRAAVGAVPEVWITSMACCREEAPRRNRLIIETARSDGSGVTQAVEAFGAYKDAFVELQSALRGLCVVKKMNLPGDKSAKAAALEPVFDAANIHVYVPGCAGAFDRWLTEFEAFPAGAHDDAVDATAIALHALTQAGSRFLL